MPDIKYTQTVNFLTPIFSSNLTSIAQLYNDWFNSDTLRLHAKIVIDDMVHVKGLIFLVQEKYKLYFHHLIHYLL